MTSFKRSVMTLEADLQSVFKKEIGRQFLGKQKKKDVWEYSGPKRPKAPTRPAMLK